MKFHPQEHQKDRKLHSDDTGKMRFGAIFGAQKFSIWSTLEQGMSI